VGTTLTPANPTSNPCRRLAGPLMGALSLFWTLEARGGGKGAIKVRETSLSRLGASAPIVSPFFTSPHETAPSFQLPPTSGMEICRQVGQGKEARHTPRMVPLECNHMKILGMINPEHVTLVRSPPNRHRTTTRICQCSSRPFCTVQGGDQEWTPVPVRSTQLAPLTPSSGS
jgi:hypothetical protein